MYQNCIDSNYLEAIVVQQHKYKTIETPCQSEIDHSQHNADGDLHITNWRLIKIGAL